MAKKAELLKQAQDLGLEVTEKNTVAEITEAISAAESKKVSGSEIATEENVGDGADKPLAKAGKRSAKAIKEAEEAKAKEERKVKAKDNEEQEKPKQKQNPTRPKSERASKRYREAAKQIDKEKSYTISEAVDLALKTSTTKFDSTVEAHIRLNVEPKQADQNVRDTVVLPAGTGKSVKVAVFAGADDVAKAKKAGADIAMEDELLEKLEKNELEFDVLIATPNMMPKLGKYARILGPKGLMPNPKSGTVTTDVAKAVEEAKAGKVEYRVDSTGIIHAAVGKASFGKEKITQNLQALFASVKANKPASLKTTYVRSIYLTTSMGPSVTVANNEL